jgi:alpha-glucosidase
MKQSALLFSLLPLAAAAICGDVSAASAPADYSRLTTISSKSLTVTVTSVDADTFHIVAYPNGLPTPPSSPYVVETTLWSGSHIDTSTGQVTVKNPDVAVSLLENGTLQVSEGGKPLLPSITLASGNGNMTVVVKHDVTDRFYGAGNAAMNTAGGLMHPSGNQIVNNGVTRIPFLWSTGGWSALVANDLSGTSWNDSAGILTWTVPAPYVDFYVSVGKDGYALLDAYSRLTGRAPIPPRWTFGYMQSRWGYADANDVQDKWTQFRTRQIPIDAFIYDYDWFVNDWQFNPTTFPAGSLDKMKSMGLHFVGIRKPRVNGSNQDFARSQGWLLNSSQGTDLHFDIPAAAYWWWSQQAPLVQSGVDGWWNDEAEQTSDEFFLMAQTEFNGWRAMKDTRAWSISRAFSPGMQRYGAAVWSGDIDSSWAALSNQPGTLLNWGLAGMPYTAQDIGGFQSTPTPELYARWIEEGVFVPVMRAHGTWNSPRWPWAFGDDVLAATKKAIELRYRLIPYSYSFAEQTAETGAPLIRPLFLEFPADTTALNIEDEWLFGDRLLAAPVLAQGGARDVYLPTGGWFDFNTNAPIAGGQTLHITAPLDVIPSYVRAGSIITLGPILQSTQAGPEDPLEIRVYPGADATFSLYEDDGDTYAYQQGESCKIPLTWDDHSKTLTVGNRTGSFSGMLQTHHLNVVLPDGTSKSIVYSGKQMRVQF